MQTSLTCSFSFSFRTVFYGHSLLNCFLEGLWAEVKLLVVVKPAPHISVLTSNLIPGDNHEFSLQHVDLFFVISTDFVELYLNEVKPVCSSLLKHCLERIFLVVDPIR